MGQITKHWIAIVRYEDEPQTAGYDVKAATAKSAFAKATRRFPDGLCVAILSGNSVIEWTPED